jgi:hypothetical protein
VGRAGFAKILITPPLGVELAGYAEDFVEGGYAANLVPRILQMPPYSPTLDDALLTGALALLESLES